MKRGKNGKQGLPPIAAVMMLVGCGGIAVWQLAGGSAPAGGTTSTETASGEVLMDGADAGAAGGEATVVWRDLLVVHGSYSKGMPVRLAFSVLDAGSAGAAPAGETGPNAGKWEGEAPPNLRLGVVMISTGARRAVLGGQIVGIGDPVGGGRVAGIDRGLVTLAWQGRILSYDLDNEVPREFRAELVRRGGSSSGQRDPQSPAGDPAQKHKEEGK